MKFRFWIAAALVLTLIGAWRAALLHPVEHLGGAGEFVHMPGATHDPDEEGGPSAACDTLAAVAACLSGGSHFAFAPAICGAAPDSGKAGNLSRSPRLAYRSQAPPLHS